MTADLFKRHKILLEDSVRMEAYKKAILKAVRPGDVVADIGCGFGILSFLALRAGAKRVYAIEAEPVTIRISKIIARANGFSSKMRFIEGISSRVKLPEKADVIISETMGSLGFNENIVPAILDARRRFLKSGGRIIPERLELFVVPVEFSRWIETVDFLRNYDGLNFIPDDQNISLGISSEAIGIKAFLSKPSKVIKVDFDRQRSDSVEGSVEFKVEREAVLAGFSGWFRALLFEDIFISTAPGASSTHWKQAFLPLRRPIKVKKRSKIRFYLRIEPDGIPFGPDSIINYNFELV